MHTCRRTRMEEGDNSDHSRLPKRVRNACLHLLTISLDAWCDKSARRKDFLERSGAPKAQEHLGFSPGTGPKGILARSRQRWAV
mmetsp:Transcript_17758/g.54633  ORF Transcript_17758/g.54633 Transcript_17758/m.54633 type:complete len:84 (-) Transcript_17758:45-296(-)